MDRNAFSQRICQGLIGLLALFITTGLFFGFYHISASAQEALSGENGWNYTAEGLTLTAQNTETGATASVTLDKEEAFVKNRTGLSMTDSSLFCEENWTEQEGIEAFHLLYEGETASGTSFSAMTPPTEPGSYTVRLVMYRVKYDAEGGWLSTEKIPFYQTSIGYSDFIVTEHTEEEKKAAGAGISLSSDGYYQVGTKEALLYVSTQCGSNVNIELTADIVYNPLSVDTGRNASSAVKTVYKWVPLGTEAAPFTGNIRGNGHTIYGLCNWDGLKYCGLIGVGRGCSVTDLTLSDCVFGGSWWEGSTGIFAGLLQLSSEDGHAIIFSNLTAHECGHSGECAGGIIGECRTVDANDITLTEQTYTDKKNYLTLTNCVSEGSMIGNSTGGGILGKLSGGTVVTIENCVNTGALESGNMLGGILGVAEGIWQRLVIQNCVNTGQFNCTNSDTERIGGIVGYLDRTTANEYDMSAFEGALRVYREDDAGNWFNDTKLDRCYSMGESNSYMAGGIAGNVEPKYLDRGIGGSLYAFNCKGVQWCEMEISAGDVPVFFYYLPEEQYEHITELSSVCAALGHRNGVFYEVTGGSACGETGTKTKYCLLCGEKQEEAALPVHEHYSCGTHCEYCSDTLASCRTHSYVFHVNENRVNAYCEKCHRTEAAALMIKGNSSLTAAEFSLCEGTPDITVKKSAGWDTSLPLVRLVYTDPNGEVTYTVPEDPADFGTVCLQVYKGKVAASVKASTQPVTLSAKWHDWQYTAKDLSLYADCAHCGASASVTMDADGANSANLNAVKYKLTDYDYEVFTDNGWRSQKGIEEYYILYNGTSVSEDHKTGIKYKAVRRPENAGSYTARAVLLSDWRDPETEILGTEAVSFYISAVPFSECDRKYYTVAQYKDWMNNYMPSKNSEGYYQVGTKEQLMAVIYSGEMKAKIDITADITVNPITVNTENGEIMCGAYDIYTWIPFGCTVTGEGTYEANLNGFRGVIRGNGHTISGLYNWNNDNYMGFVNHGMGCTITDLTLENCVFNGKLSCGTFVGQYDTQTPNMTEMNLSGLKSYRCYISSSTNAGGILGTVYPSYGYEYGGDRSIPGPSTYYRALALDYIHWGYSYYQACNRLGCDCALKHNFFNIRDSISGSTVKGGNAAGGIVGAFNWATVVSINHCVNFGTVESNKSAGGILGLIDEKWQKLTIINCMNGGYIKGSENLGGIVGLVDASAHYDNRDTTYDQGRLTEYLFRSNEYYYIRPVYFNDTLIESCVSVGDLGAGTYTGGIVGYYNMTNTDLTWGSAAMFDCKYAKTREAVGGHNSAGFTFSAYGLRDNIAEHLRSDTALSYLCTERLGGHLSEAQWEYDTDLGCETERTAVKKCRICGTVLETRTVSAHTHQYVLGECNFCGEEETTGTASVFSENHQLLLPMAGVILLAAVAAILISHRKRKAA